MVAKKMTENDISYIVRGAIFKVYNTLGPGLLESVYVAALVFELKKAGLVTRTEVPIPVIYENEKLELGFRLDILVNELVIIEENLLNFWLKYIIKLF